MPALGCPCLYLTPYNGLGGWSLFVMAPSRVQDVLQVRGLVQMHQAACNHASFFVSTGSWPVHPCPSHARQTRTACLPRVSFTDVPTRPTATVLCYHRHARLASGSWLQSISTALPKVARAAFFMREREKRWRHQHRQSRRSRRAPSGGKALQGTDTPDQ